MKYFHTPVTLNILFDLFDKVCLSKETYYVFEMTSFNKMKYLNLYEPFIQTLKEYYYPCYYYYLDAELNLKNFMKIIKQICDYHHLKFTLKKVVLQSHYFIEHPVFEQPLHSSELATLY
jgi:hypothetical protein